jgi:hypothetical protein
MQDYQQFLAWDEIENSGISFFAFATLEPVAEAVVKGVSDLHDWRMPPS